MNIINGFKIKFGEFMGSTYALNRLKETFEQEFNYGLTLNEHDNNLCIIIENEELHTEESIKNMFYFVKGYCMAHKNINFFPYRLFK